MWNLVISVSFWYSASDNRGTVGTPALPLLWKSANQSNWRRSRLTGERRFRPTASAAASSAVSVRFRISTVPTTHHLPATYQVCFTSSGDFFGRTALYVSAPTWCGGVQRLGVPGAADVLDQHSRPEAEEHRFVGAPAADQRIRALLGEHMHGRGSVRRASKCGGCRRRRNAGRGLRRRSRPGPAWCRGSRSAGCPAR